MKDKIIKVIKVLGLGFFEPLFRLNENPKRYGIEFFKKAIVPVLTMVIFLWLWGLGAEGMQSSQNENSAEVIYSNAFDKAKKQLKKSEEEAKKYAKNEVESFWANINKEKYLDKVYDDISSELKTLSSAKLKDLKKSGIPLKGKELAYEVYSDLPPLVRNSIRISKDTAYGVSSSTAYLFFNKADLNKMPKDVVNTTYDGTKISLTTSDLKSIKNRDPYRYFYEMDYLPRPKDVWKKWKLLKNEHVVEKEKEDAFYKSQEKEIASIKASKIADDLKKKKIKGIKARKYPGYPTFFDQIFTSIYTVITALILAAFVGVPIGIFMGLSPVFRTAINPIVQLFKPVSPVVWYMIVAMIVNALVDTETALLPKSFTISFISVAACSMWATLVNTSFGVASVSQDLLNVADVLKVQGLQRVFKVILPSSIPMIFTGLRITVTTSWMVLIAVELLAQNPGLGKFVWDEFQNGSSNSNGKIVVAMFVIGLIGFILDRIMMLIQKSVSYDKKNIT